MLEKHSKKNLMLPFILGQRWKSLNFCNNKTEPWPLFKPLQPLHHTHVVSSNDMKRGTHRYSFHLAATH